MTPEQLQQKLESKHHFTAETGYSLSFVDGKVFTETNITADYTIIDGHAPGYFRMEFSNVEKIVDSQNGIGSDFKNIMIVIDNDTDFPVFINSIQATTTGYMALKGFDHPSM